MARTYLSTIRITYQKIPPSKFFILEISELENRVGARNPAEIQTVLLSTQSVASESSGTWQPAYFASPSSFIDRRNRADDLEPDFLPKNVIF